MSPLLFRDINIPLPSIPVLGEVMNSRIFLMFSPNFIFQIYCNSVLILLAVILTFSSILVSIKSLSDHVSGQQAISCMLLLEQKTKCLFKVNQWENNSASPNTLDQLINLSKPIHITAADLATTPTDVSVC